MQEKLIMGTKIIIAFMLSLMIVWVYVYKTKTLSTTLVNPIPEYIEPPKEGEAGPQYEQEVLALVNEVNGQNKTIRSLTCSDIAIKATCEGGVPIALWSEVYYEKDKNFRMINKSRLGKEADMGSNNQQFWFWSKRMHPPTLYYASHSDLIKVPLRPPLNPLWLMECMNVSEITTKNTKARKYGEYWALYQSRVSTLGTLVTKMTLIDPQNKRIIGHYLYNEENKLMASSEPLEFADCGTTSVPTKSKMCWQEEGVVMIFQFNDISVNSHIEEDRWALPNYWKKQDMAELTP